MHLRKRYGSGSGPGDFSGLGFFSTLYSNFFSRALLHFGHRGFINLHNGFQLVGFVFDIQLACIQIGKARNCDTWCKVLVLMARGDAGLLEMVGKHGIKREGVCGLAFFFFFFLAFGWMGWDGMNGWEMRPARWEDKIAYDMEERNSLLCMFIVWMRKDRNRR